MRLTHITLVVRDYDEAIQFFCGKLSFRLVEDTRLDALKRWVVVSAGDGSRLVLAKAKDADEVAAIGNQTGGRVFLFLECEDFWDKYKALKANGIAFIEEPREEAYGTVVVFKDLYGNKWDLISRIKA